MCCQTRTARGVFAVCGELGSEEQLIFAVADYGFAELIDMERDINNKSATWKTAHGVAGV